MSDFNFQCPKCNNGVVWKFFYPKTRADYCCQLCGNCWNQPMKETCRHYGPLKGCLFLGMWAEQEMTKLEENLSSVHPSTDWNFFKGRKIYTAWQTSLPTQFITTRSRDELTYWVAIATQKKHGNWYETYCRLADESFGSLDTPYS